jgi:D-tagatose-1,6-bisphosphate aldolase subunit GatZ/KbaZ
MVQDHFCLLKVGPCLTFAFREAVFALARLEEAWHEIEHKSNLMQVMDHLMRADPRHLTPLQRGGSDRARRLRQTSLRDRIRYYWSHPRAQAGIGQLLRNLDRPIPRDLLLQFLPDHDNVSRQQGPGAILLDHIRKTLEPYMDACR